MYWPHNIKISIYIRINRFIVTLPSCRKLSTRRNRVWKFYKTLWAIINSKARVACYIIESRIIIVFTRIKRTKNTAIISTRTLGCIVRRLTLNIITGSALAETFICSIAECGITAEARRFIAFSDITIIYRRAAVVASWLFGKNIRFTSNNIQRPPGNTAIEIGWVKF